MKITVSGKQLDVGVSLSEYVEESLNNSVKKYFDRAIDADVVFYKDAHLFCTDIIVNEGTGKNLLIRAQAREEDVYASFDKANQRIEKQLRRYKRRLKSHHRPEANNILAMAATKYVLNDDGQEVEEGFDHTPLIIAEKPTSLEILSVSDAVMRMNLAGLPALLFINEKTDGLDVVYRREDGNISWVESKHKASLSQAAKVA